MSSSFCWCAQVRYPGKKPCWFGTVVCDKRATMTEVERTVRQTALEFVPEGFEIIQLVRGEFIFSRHDED